MNWFVFFGTFTLLLSITGIVLDGTNPDSASSAASFIFALLACALLGIGLRRT